ncbi:MAG TPA: hypothetical protein VLB44_23840 [Kofleriaceae bacterium]|nr:hypothetical protein [Kofleriaceae bacterium]
MRAWVLACLVTLIACGGKPPIPKRGVVESDLGGWKFRRFQPVLDVEVWVENNKAEAYTASYVSEEAEKRGHVEDKDVVNVFVTRYEKDDGVLRETVKLARRLAAEAGYQVDEHKVGGARALTINGHGESWVLWASKKHVVKVGGRGRESVPESLVESYADRYPSNLPGGALEGPLPAGPDNQGPKPGEKEEYDPNNPKADLDKVDSSKLKLPDAKDKDKDTEEPKDKTESGSKKKKKK